MPARLSCAKPTGASVLASAARSALLHALVALNEQRSAAVLVGAQAIYLRTGTTKFLLAERTEGADFALDPRQLAPLPLLEDAMQAAWFATSLTGPQPGAWLSHDVFPVELMVPEALAGGAGSWSEPPGWSRAAVRNLAVLSWH